MPLPLQRRVGARNQAPGAQHRAGEAQQTSFYSGLYGVTLGHQIPLVAQTFVINRYRYVALKAVSKDATDERDLVARFVAQLSMIFLLDCQLKFA